jgi:hypothetical protein
MGINSISNSGIRTFFRSSSILARNPAFFPAPILTGGTLSSDSTYYYITFTANGSLQISNQALTADVLIVSGGGGGGATGGIGSGAGGGALRFISNQAFVPNNYVVIVGAGGTTIPDGESAGLPGGQSEVGVLLASVQNGGKLSPSGRSGNGGDSRLIIGTTETNFSGGSAGSSVAPGRAGGGGASAAGNGGSGVSGSSAGTGANGPDTYSSWASATLTGHLGRYGGGGSGGFEFDGNRARTAGGAGGGGAGGAGTTSPFFNAENGLQNTGGGGGGCGGRTNIIGGASGNGGSGIVIIRYLRSAVGG